MRTVSVADVAEQVTGVTYKKDQASKEFAEGQVGVLRAGNIDSIGNLAYDDLVYVPLDCVKPAQLLRQNDVLIATSSGSLDVVGKAGIAQEDRVEAFGAFCKVLRPGPEVDPRYFAQCFRRPEYRHYVERVAAGININNLKKSHLAEIEIPLPPIEEQRRIAAVLDAADELRTKRRQALAKLDTLTQAVFIDMFGDLASNDRGWPVLSVADFVDRFESGKSIAAGPDETPGGLRVLKVSAVTSRSYKADESKPVPAGYLAPETHRVRPGDLLMSRANTTELVGACAYVETTPDGLLLPDKLWRFVWHDAPKVEPLYVWRALQDRDVRRQIEDAATGSSGSMKNISQTKFMSVTLPFPPVEKQRAFGSAIRALRAKAESGHRSLGALDTLFASLQQRAFAGEL